MSELKEFEDKMKVRITSLEKEFASIRVGRANPSVLDHLTVDYYGTPTPFSQVANISVPEARMIQIQPWEKNMLKNIERSILASDLGINPNNDGTTIRLVFPDLTEERRKNVAKDVSRHGEDAKVSIRNIRREAMDLYQKQEKSGDISEDYLNTMEGNIQDLTNTYTGLVDTKVSDKQKDIMNL